MWLPPLLKVFSIPWERLRAGEERSGRGWNGWMDVSLSKLQDIVKDREACVLPSKRSQRVGHDRATEQQQHQHVYNGRKGINSINILSRARSYFLNKTSVICVIMLVLFISQNKWYILKWQQLADRWYTFILTIIFPTFHY